MKVIAISGGIGSGKSVVARILTIMGYRVYDCDSRAKAIMDSDHAIKHAIARDIAADAILPSGEIDRRRLGEIVFTDHSRLDRLNAIVHRAVKRDIATWIKRHADEPLLFIETAILYQSGLNLMVDHVLEVEADIDVRVERVCRRNDLTPDEVMQRIVAQQKSHEAAMRYTSPDAHHLPVTRLDNSGRRPLLPQILTFINNPK